MASKKKEPEYTEIGELLCPETAYVQAAYALDVAAHHAVTSRNVGEIVKAADAWVRLAESMNSASSSDEDSPPEEQKVDKKDPDFPVGFRVKEKDE